METEKMCSHPYVIIKWVRDENGDLTNGYWSIYDGVTYRGMAYCIALGCHSHLHDEDPIAKYAFEQSLTNDTNQTKGIAAWNVRNYSLPSGSGKSAKLKN